MLSEKQIDAVEETAAELKRRREHRPPEALRARPAVAPASSTLASSASGQKSQEELDLEWSRANLRFQDGKPVLDIANALRVFERHEVFAGRFKYNETLTKVMDKGAVMLEWRVSEVVAVMQERFLPGIAPDYVSKALLVFANRAIQKK